MQVGDYVIANDLIGVIESDAGVCWNLKDEEGKLHEVKKESCVEIVSSHALAASIYVKLRKKANIAKNKN